MRSPLLLVDELVLDPPSPEDAEAWCACQDDECAHWFDWPHRPDVARCRAHLTRVSLDDSPTSYVWAIRDATGLVGGIDLKVVDQRWNVSYFVHPDHRDRHVATRSLLAVCRWAFEELRIPAVTTRVHVDNAASQRVLENAGFESTGVEPNPDADDLDLLFRLDRPDDGAT
ncbi:GNAT family N-acetyltransferase [Acidipropionibacterium timonense]|uniref:GNAT family N-acetyltransferase n=1 Tax=Acidipropionibacterium timonense TaxID=2161818 RepID=UPI001436CB10|nr:GNAT family N-acetyltransferase [Acidipropionibacterium timonense]